MKYSFFLKEKKIDNLFFLSISYFIGIKYIYIYIYIYFNMQLDG